MDERWTIPKEGGWSKAGWTPFAGRSVRGRVRTVVIRGQQVFVDGQFVVPAGFGQNVRLQKPQTTEAEELEAGKCTMIIVESHW